MSVNVYCAVKSNELSKIKITNLVDQICSELKIPTAEISVHLIGDKKMRALNRQYRRIYRTTDVLSFATESTNDNDLGDIFISLPQIKKQAKEYEVPWLEEFTRMLVHGILHLIGLDHQTAETEKKMFKIQEKLVKKMIK